MPAEATRRRRTRARRGEGDRLRQEILDAAGTLLVAAGDEEGVSIRAVADAVGCTPPSIYLHFADKTELIWAVCEEYFTELDRRLQEAAAGVDDPVEALRRRGRAYVRFGLERPEQYRVLFMGRPRGAPEGYAGELARGGRCFGHLVDAVAALGPPDPFLAATALWTACHGLVSLLIAKPEFAWPARRALVEHVLETQVRGLTPSS